MAYFDKQKMLKLFLVFKIFSLSFLVSAQTISLDPTFGNAGIVRTNFSKSTDLLESLVLLDDGKILLGGYTALDTLGSQFVLAKYQPNGTLDDTFGEEGIVILGFDYPKSFLRNLTILEDKKIMAFGTTADFESEDTYMVFVRFHSNGELDKSFGAEGKLLVKSEIPQENVLSIRAQGKDKIIVLTNTLSITTNNESYLKRYFIDGTLDKAFGNEGQLFLSTAEQNQSVRSISITPTEEIIVYGVMGSNSHDSYFIQRYDGNGELDLSFGENGFATTNFGVGIYDAETTIQQSDGKILALGNLSKSGKNDFTLTRYHNDGSIDETFGENGKIFTDLSNRTAVALQTHDTANGLTIQEDGKIIVVGGTAERTGKDYQFVLVRYNANGDIDKDFGENGQIVQSIANESAIGRFPIFQSDGKIILGGIIRDLNVSNLDGEFFVARYITDLYVGTLDFSLNKNSMLIYPNPIKNTATLEYTLEKPETLTIQLTDLQGRILKTYLQNHSQNAGAHQLDINLPAHLPKGMYFLRLSSSNGQMMVKVMK